MKIVLNILKFLLWKPFRFLLNLFIIWPFRLLQYIFTKIVSKVIKVEMVSKGAGIILSGICTAAYVWFVLPTIALTIFWAAIIIPFSRYETHEYSRATTIVSGELYTTTTCERYPCRAGRDSSEYRIQDNPYMMLEWFLKYRIPYDSREIAAAFNEEGKKCKTRLVLERNKIFNINPVILEAECEETKN